MFRDRPALAADLLGGPLHVAVPEFDKALLSPGELTDVVPTEYRADAVVTLERAGSAVLGVVVEVQRHVDPRKRRSWPAYVATLHARLGCLVALLVICTDQSVAAWGATPIPVGEPGFVLTPIVLGPDQVPVITDLDTARRAPELTVLSALAHGAEPDPNPIFAAMFAALDVLDPDHAKLYADFVLTVLPEATQRYLEGLMTATSDKYTSDLARRLVSEGKAETLLEILDGRGIEVPDAVRSDIAGCTDLDRLKAWALRVSTVQKIQDLDDQFA